MDGTEAKVFTVDELCLIMEALSDAMDYVRDGFPLKQTEIDLTYKIQRAADLISLRSDTRSHTSDAAPQS